MNVSSDIKILDCTIRDGGYYTNWDFDKDLVQKYCEYLNSLPVEYIEIGYRSQEKKDEYFGEYFYLPLSTVKEIKKYTDKKLSIMLNAKDNNSDLDILLSDIKDYISLVRIATDPNKIEFSIQLAQQIKKLGFEVAINVMYISNIDKNHIFFDHLDNIGKYLDTLNLVDSYGSIYPEELDSLIKRVQKKTNITLGFHGHNNIELAFSNSIKAIECGVEYIDSTILGMGRGAGNLKTELIFAYIKSKKNIEVDLNSLGRLTELFGPLQTKYKWGANLAYMVAGCYSLPQRNVMDALAIERYSLSGIVNQLKNDGEIRLPVFEADKNIESCLIIGGGNSVEEHIEAIKEYLSLNAQILIIYATSKYIKLFEDIENTQYFSVVGDELLKLNSFLHVNKYILEPSPRKVNNYIKNKTNFYELEKINFINKHIDSPLSVSLQITLDIKVQNIYLVGFDGYSELKNKKELYLMQENQEIIDSFLSQQELVSLTSTKYKNLKKRSVYGI